MKGISSREEEMYWLSSRKGVALIVALLILNQGVANFRSVIQGLIEVHLFFKGVEKKSIGSAYVQEYGERGDSASIVLPDLFDDLYSWSLQITALSTEQHWILMDYPIFQSEAEENNTVVLLSGVLEDVWASHDKGIRRVVAHGTSALLAIEAAEKEPELIRELVLINPILPGYFPKKSRMLPLNAQGAKEKLESFVGQDIPLVPSSVFNSWVDHYQQGAYDIMVQSMKNHVVSFPKHSLSVQIVWSEPNPFAEQGSKSALKIIFPQAKWTNLEGCGFAPHYLCGDVLAPLLNEQ